MGWLEEVKRNYELYILLFGFAVFSSYLLWLQHQEVKKDNGKIWPGMLSMLNLFGAGCAVYILLQEIQFQYLSRPPTNPHFFLAGAAVMLPGAAVWMFIYSWRVKPAQWTFRSTSAALSFMAIAVAFSILTAEQPYEASWNPLVVASRSASLLLLALSLGAAVLDIRRIRRLENR
ncbi:MAG TPA: hypothetical protein VFZ58_00570 [Candidatus Saccharimonadales bacterium]